MTTLRQAAQAVIERWDSPPWLPAIPTIPAMTQRMEDLRTALEAPEQEPVAWFEYNASLDAWFLSYGFNPKAKTKPLYAAPVEAPDIKALQAQGKGPAPCARFCEATAFQNSIRQAKRGSEVLQAKCDAFLANVQLLEVELEAMAKERDRMVKKINELEMK